MYLVEIQCRCYQRVIHARKIMTETHRQQLYLYSYNAKYFLRTRLIVWFLVAFPNS